jgi:hypothetical protein
MDIHQDKHTLSSTYGKHIQQKISYYLEDDQLRLLFIVVLLIGMILLLSGVNQAVLFMLFGFAIIAFLCIFKPKKTLMENFICDGFYDILEDSEILTEDSRISEIGISVILESSNNPENFKFKNSTRN